MKWLQKHAESLEAIAAVVTAIAAVAALIGVAWQIRANDALQAKQSARDLYREFLTLSVQSRDVAALEFCAINSAPDRVGYEAYVEHLLYTAEQVITLDPAWREPIRASLQDHASYVCSRSSWDGYVPEVLEVLQQVDCEAAVTCPAQAAE